MKWNMGSTVLQSTKTTQSVDNQINLLVKKWAINQLAKSQSKQLSNYSAGQQVINQLVISHDISLIHQFINKYIVSNFVKRSVIIQYYRISRGFKQVISYIFQPLSQQDSQGGAVSQSVKQVSLSVSLSALSVNCMSATDQSVNGSVNQLFIYLFTSFSGHRPAQRECTQTGLRSHVRCHPYPIPHPVKVGRTTGVYDPYSFRVASQKVSNLVSNWVQQVSQLANG